MAPQIRSHPLLHWRNWLELLFQSPVWFFLYSTGLVALTEPMQWVVYGLGWHIKPDRYPPPHTTLFDFCAHCLICLRHPEGLRRQRPRLAKTLIALVLFIMVVVFPILFLGYAMYLMKVFQLIHPYWIQLRGIIHI